MADVEEVHWQSLVIDDEGQELQFRQHQMYSMRWEASLDLGASIVAVARHGGPIAITRDPTRMALVTGSVKRVMGVRVFTASGAPICQFPLPRDDKVKQLAWTASHRLVIVFETGFVDLYTTLGTHLETLYLSPDPEDAGNSLSNVVSLVAFSASALAATVMSVTTHTTSTLIVPDLDSDTPYVEEVTGLPSSGSARPSALAFVESAFVNEVDSPAHLLVTLTDRSARNVWFTETMEAEVVVMDEPVGSVVTMIAVAPNGRFMALLTEDGLLTFTSTSFDVTLFRNFDPEASVPPNQLLWCGEDSVLLSWHGKGLLMVGPSGSWLKYSYLDPIHVVQETDCARIISTDFHTVLQHVPPPTAAIREIGGHSPAAQLFDATEAFHEGDISSEDILRELQAAGTLVMAVEDCLQAATHEFDAHKQTSFLQAAAFGKSFEPDFYSDYFVDACRKLRVMNTLRAPAIGMPITHDEYELLGVDGVLDRLMNRHLYKVAVDVCGYLGTPRDRVVVHWACQKIEAASTMSDEDLCDLLLSRLRSVKSVSYAAIAESANRSARRGLATMLLAHEADPKKQVKLLLDMNVVERALEHAVASGDTNLIYTVIMWAKKRVSRSGDPAAEEDSMFGLLSAHPPAFALLTKYCRARDPAMLRRMYKYSGNSIGTARIDLEASASARDPEDRKELLQRAAGTLSDAVAAGGDKGLVFYQKLVEDEMYLVGAQETLDAVPRDTVFDGLSVSQTLFHLLFDNQESKASSIRSDLKVPDNRYAHIKVLSLTKSSNWGPLHKLSTEKKLPIDLMHFVTACLAAGSRVEAAKYVRRLSDPEKKMDGFMKTGNWKEAAELAAKHKDMARLQRISAACSAPEVVRLIASVTGDD